MRYILLWGVGGKGLLLLFAAAAFSIVWWSFFIYLHKKVVVVVGVDKKKYGRREKQKGRICNIFCLVRNRFFCFVFDIDIERRNYAELSAQIFLFRDLIMKRGKKTVYVGSLVCFLI